MGQNRTLLGEIWNFLKVRKAYWLVPSIILLLIFSVAIYVTVTGGSINPFIYALF